MILFLNQQINERGKIKTQLPKKKKTKERKEKKRKQKRKNKALKFIKVV